MSSLREALSMAKANESLASLPDRLAELFVLYSREQVHPTFRHDIHGVLDGAIGIALAMVDSSFPVTQATLAISRQQATLARLLAFVQEDRAREHGFSVQTDDGRLLGYFSSEAAAIEQAHVYAALGVACRVVPSLLSSLSVVQPRRIAAPEEALSEVIPIASTSVADAPAPIDTKAQEKP